MNSFLQKRYPLLIAGLFLAVTLLVVCLQILARTNGHFCYPLDDTFIHMTIAKNLALNGTWGINPQEFSSASSSPLYTLILALLFRLGSTSIWMPFAVNVLFAGGLLYISDKLLERFQMGALARTITLLLVIFFTPVTVMVVSGMEHMLHAFLAVWLIYKAIDWLQSDRTDSKTVILTGVIAGLAIMARFEALFLLAAIVALGIYNKKWGSAFVILVIAFIPMVIFGYWSIQQGGYFLPNSVLLKGSHLGGGWQQIKSSLQEIVLYKLTYGNNTMMNIFSHQYYPEGASSLSGTALVRLLIVIPVLMLTLKATPGQEVPVKRAKQLAVIFIITCFLHLALASVGWLFRYEAYLVAIGTLAGCLLLYPRLTAWKDKFIQQSLLEKAIFLFVVIFTLGPLPMRAMSAYNNLPQACRNIYEQQYQMGTFLQQYYQHTTIAANDIGAVSYMANNRIIDMWGLGNNIVAASKLKGYYTPAFLQEFSQQQQVKIAVVYDSWFDPALLQHWKKVAAWKISNNVICGADEVSFYAVDPAAAATLQEQLKAFHTQMPAGVQVNYY